MNSLRWTSLVQGSHEFARWLKRLFLSPVFLFVTLWGHLAICAGAWSFYHYESAAIPGGKSFFHCYYWAISLATTTGSSDLIPLTAGGKVTAIFLMVSGSLFLWSYTALFAASLVAPTVGKVGRRMDQLEEDVEEVERDVKIDHRTLERLLEELEKFNRKEQR